MRSGLFLFAPVPAALRCSPQSDAPHRVTTYQRMDTVTTERNSANKSTSTISSIRKGDGLGRGVIVFLYNKSGNLGKFAAIRRASIAIPAIWPVIGIRRRNTNTPTVAAIKRPQCGSHACVVPSVVMVTVDRARFGRSLRSSGCTRGLFIHTRSNLTTWNGAWC